MKENLLFCPLGGSGEIGMNMNFLCLWNRRKFKVDNR